MKGKRNGLWKQSLNDVTTGAKAILFPRFGLLSIVSKHRNQLTQFTIVRKTINEPIMSNNVN